MRPLAVPSPHKERPDLYLAENDVLTEPFDGVNVMLMKGLGVHDRKMHTVRCRQPTWYYKRRTSCSPRIAMYLPEFVEQRSSLSDDHVFVNHGILRGPYTHHVVEPTGDNQGPWIVDILHGKEMHLALILHSAYSPRREHPAYAVPVRRRRPDIEQLRHPIVGLCNLQVDILLWGKV